MRDKLGWLGNKSQRKGEALRSLALPLLWFCGWVARDFRPSSFKDKQRDRTVGHNNSIIDKMLRKSLYFGHTYEHELGFAKMNLKTLKE